MVYLPESYLSCKNKFKSYLNPLHAPLLSLLCDALSHNTIAPCDELAMSLQDREIKKYSKEAF